MLTMWFRDHLHMLKNSNILGATDSIYTYYTQKHKIKFKVDGYMTNGGKKNETDSRLDCYHNSPVKLVLTLRICGISQQCMCGKYFT